MSTPRAELPDAPLKCAHQIDRAERMTLLPLRFLSLWIGVLLIGPCNLVHGGVPEPDLVLYGVVSGAAGSTPYFPGSVTWTVSGNGESIASHATTLVTVNEQTFYVSRVAFETRRLADGTLPGATPNSLGLTATATSYTRNARVDGRLATLVAGSSTFSYGAATQGLMERLDLRVGGESFAEWSQRLFGAAVAMSADADGDASSNYEEYLAGTDPRSPNSRLAVRNFVPLPGGGFSFSWDSVSGRQYSVERSPDLKTWSTVLANQPGTGAVLSYSDTNSGSAQRMFYRVRASAP